MAKRIRINKALGRHAKLFFIDIENVPALVASASLGLISSQFTQDISVPILLTIGTFATWLLTVNNNPKGFLAKFHQNHPPQWKRGRVFYSHPLKKSQSK